MVTESEWKEVEFAMMWEFKNDHEMFTEGACHILAQAIANRTGWLICGFDDGYDIPTDHAFIFMDNGLCLDIDGVSTVREMCERWDMGSIKPFGVDFNFSENDWENWFEVKPCWDRANELADDLIRLGKES